MKDIIRIQDVYYIRVTSPRLDDRTRTLKQGETFGVFDRHGDVHEAPMGEYGIYHGGTRHVSRAELTVNGQSPVLLSSTVKEDNVLLTADLTNPDLEDSSEASGCVRRGLVHIFRSKLLWEGACFERIRVTSYSQEPVRFRLSLGMGADFRDVFEVRGFRRARRGKLHTPEIAGGGLVLAYAGLDGVVRRTRILFDPQPDELGPDGCRFLVSLDPGETQTLYVAFCFTDREWKPKDYEAVYEQALGTRRRQREEAAHIYTSNEQFNDWLNRSVSDLQMLQTETEWGSVPYGGVPWFSAPFGRDAVITALEWLWANPAPARGVLSFLAAHQGRERDPEREEEPGKILHEMRQGELAQLGEIPFGRYYGSVDATPLFVLLAGAYLERTADEAFIREIWPAVSRALEWMVRDGDRDGDGFIEYEARPGAGLVHQGWKDSSDAVFREDGSSVFGRIALCEVQGYAYAAYRAAGRIAFRLGRLEESLQWRARSRELRSLFHQKFWMEDRSAYALALDEEKTPCRVLASNTGHCLWSGIASPDHARKIARVLLSEPMFTGWGVRTLGSGEVRYNPMSYHNGSVWPHDNAIIAAGLARYGLKKEAMKILTGLFDASIFFDLNRLPELFCGFPRRPGEGPTEYPVACIPQAWAAASVFLMLQACLGLRIDARGPTLYFDYPCLPPFLERVEIQGLRVGQATANLTLNRKEEDVVVNVEKRQGGLRVVITK
jgi:glycogen debranching enzyme